MSDHTPGLVHIEDVWNVVDANDNQVAACGSHTTLTPERRVANAERIVLTWNCHDDLLEALRQILAEWDASDGATVSCLTMDDARAAIAKAVAE